jgi:hypothetical protein
LQDDQDVDEKPSSDTNRRHPRHQNQNNELNTVDSSHASEVTITGSLSLSVTTSGSRITLSTLPRLLPGVIYRWYTSLRHAHNAAARVQAAERVERIREMGRARNDPGTEDASMEGWGWSWEGLGWRRGRSRGTSRASPKRTNNKAEEVVEEEKQTKRGRRISRKKIQEESEGYEMRNCRGRSVDEEPGDIPDEDDQQGGSRLQQIRTDHDPERRTQNTPPDGLPPAAATSPRSVWWWGPLRRWRLQDATIY